MAGVHSLALCQLTQVGHRISKVLLSEMLSLVEDEVTDSFEHTHMISVWLANTSLHRAIYDIS